jgi:hypothetical protein
LLRRAKETEGSERVSIVPTKSVNEKDRALIPLYSVMYCIPSEADADADGLSVPVLETDCDAVCVAVRVLTAERVADGVYDFDFVLDSEGSTVIVRTTDAVEYNDVVTEPLKLCVLTESIVVTGVDEERADTLAEDVADMDVVIEFEGVAGSERRAEDVTVPVGIVDADAYGETEPRDERFAVLLADGDEATEEVADSENIAVLLVELVVVGDDENVVTLDPDDDNDATDILATALRRAVYVLDTVAE